MRIRGLLSFISSAALLLALAAAGCGGGGLSDEEIQTLLEQMVLTGDDLPAGLQRVSAVFTTNEEAAMGGANPDLEMALLEQWGRRLGYEVTFVRTADASPGLPVRGLLMGVSLYDESEGAGRSLAADVSAARASDAEAAYPDREELKVVEIEGRQIGEETFWVRASGFRAGGSGALLADDQVAFRVGPVRAFLRVDSEIAGATDRSVYVNQVEAWARLVRDRINEALGVSVGG